MSESAFLIRDDEKPLLFDISHIPVMRFNTETIVFAEALLNLR